MIDSPHPGGETMHSVLDRAMPDDIDDEPFPHLVLRGALPDDLYDRLQATFPRTDEMRRLNPGGKFSHEARNILADARLDPIWRDFVAHQTSGVFYRQVVALLGDRIRRIHP